MQPRAVQCRHSAVMPTQAFFQDLLKSFDPQQKKEATPPEPKFDPVVVEPDFRVAALFLGGGILLDTLPILQFTLGPILTLLGVLFLVQAYRVRFRFDEEGYFEVLLNAGDELKQSGENFAVGGENKWKTSSIVNYDFFPGFDSALGKVTGPILVYFKETQTPEDSWDVGPGKYANDLEKIQAGSAVPGQVHFFPAVAKAEQIRDEFVKRNVKKL